MTARWGYLGPEGTFTEQAARELSERRDESVELVPAAGVSAVLSDLRAARVDAAVVPLENSVEGAVALTQDELIHGDPVMVVAEAYVPVRFVLLARPGTHLADVATVGSHPHGLAQARDWLAHRLPGAELVVSTSTAAAAALVAEGGCDAAVAAAVAGERYGLIPLAHDIGLRDDALTRFVLLTRPGPVAQATGNDRSSLILTLDNRPGALLEVLSEIAGRGINMTRLESRPKRGHPGEYVFLVDVDGHLRDPAMADVVAALMRRAVLLRWLGSYPRADGSVVPAPYFARPEAYDRAGKGLSALLAGMGSD